ncbi:hypothetical protein AAC387_Pa07g1622 [Persea americana]
MANWIDLFHDVLERIFYFCGIPDHIRLQSVCKSWRSILKNSVPSELPWLICFPTTRKKKTKIRTLEFSTASPSSRSTLFVSQRYVASAAVGLLKMAG